MVERTPRKPVPRTGTTRSAVPVPAAAAAAALEMGGERLAKRVAELKTCSRREAEQTIEGGWVKVDGQVVESPAFRVTRQAITIDPNANLMALLPVTLVLHKPPGVLAEMLSQAQIAHAGRPGQAVHAPRVTQAHRAGHAVRGDKPGSTAPTAMACLTPANHFAQDPGGMRVLQRHFSKLEMPVPLETGASGLLVFTQDWRVSRKLVEDGPVLEHEFIVEVTGEVDLAALERVNHGLLDRGQALPRVRASLNSDSETTSKLRFAVKGAHPGLIAYLCERLGLTVQAMRRIRIGRVSMTHLPVGQWRFLGTHERF